MVLHFPNLDVLKLAITSGTVPEGVVAAGVQAGFGEGGDVWLQPSVRIARSVRAALRRLGMGEQRAAKIPLTASLRCWLQVFPLHDDGSTTAQSSKTPVLFDLPAPEQLPGLVAEILRLGNDRQSFCHVESAGRVRTLLRVVGPPYYSLLRAIDRDATDDARPWAYVEQAPRVWVELGRRHPLADRIVPPPGQLLLIREARQWDFVDETPFQDVYRVLDCPLPYAPAQWKPAPRAQRITVPLRLVPGGTETPELWVLGDDGDRQLDALVGSADDQLLARLAFAVGELDGQRKTVIRLRPSKLSPPVVVLEGVAFRPYLKLPGLFVPCNWRVHPPLRRSAIGEILAPDAARVTWLYPHGGGTFTPESLPDTAFRPLSDWVDYVLDREHTALAAWIESNQFDFEPFVVADEHRVREEKPKRPAGARPEPVAPDDPVQPHVEEARPVDPIQPGEVPSTLVLEGAGETERDALQKRLSQWEEEFLASDAPLDSPARGEQWTAMARLNAALGYHLDSAVCFATAAWEDDARVAPVVAPWRRCAEEASGIALTAAELDGVLADPDLLADRAAALAGQVICAAHTAPVPDALSARLSQVARYLERHEALLPVRIAWLAWKAVDRLSGGDVLALARARDRALERLYQHGLRPDVDLPSFLRGLGSADSGQLRLLRERVGRLHALVADWVQESPSYPHAHTREYVGLLFAYAMARMGEATQGRLLAEEASGVLLHADAVHRWLCGAFQSRVREALAGQANRGRLSDERLAELETMDRIDRYKIDRLRQNSRILEPSEKIDPYRNWRRHADDFTREVTLLVDVAGRDELLSRIETLFAQVDADRDRSAREATLLAAALELAPRLGEEFAVELLGRVVPLLGRGVEAVAGQLVLERALFVAAHFDLRQSIDLFMTRIHGLLERQQPDAALDSLERMLSECFRGLRKLGMRDEIGRLLSRVSVLAHAVQQGDRSGKRGGAETPPAGEVALRLLLLAAGGWLFFGQQREAIGVLDEVRTAVLEGDWKPSQRTDLTRSYLTALGFAPAEFALPRIEELFAPGPPGSDGSAAPRLPRVSDNLTTTSHFSLFQLKIVESLVLAIVGEECATSTENRRWLDEDEFLVRRRIHHDVRTALGHPT